MRKQGLFHAEIHFESQPSNGYIILALTLFSCRCCVFCVQLCLFVWVRAVYIKMSSLIGFFTPRRANWMSCAIFLLTQVEILKCFHIRFFSSPLNLGFCSTWVFLLEAGVNRTNVMFPLGSILTAVKSINNAKDGRTYL